MAYPNDCQTTPQETVDYANKDNSRLIGEATRFQYQTDPYMSLYGRQTIPNISESVRTVTIEHAFSGHSLTRPLFTNFEDSCGKPGQITQLGSTEFTVRPGLLRGQGPKICVLQQRVAFPSVWGALVASLRDSIREVVGADNRANLLDNSGLKFVADTTGTIAQTLTGDTNVVGAHFAARLPNAPVNMGLLEYLGRQMREVYSVRPYEGQGRNGSLLAIGGMDIIQKLRDESNVREDIGSLTTGRYKMGEETITGYAFEGPYHGIAFGFDRRPLRFNAMTTVANGAADPNTGVINTGASYNTPVLLEPYTATNVTKGVGGRTSTTWNAATYEIMFLVGDNGFNRGVPESYKVEGFDFPALMDMNGGLRFKLLDDADCFMFNDFGLHLFQVGRAFVPKEPHAVMAIAFARCDPDTGMVVCGS